MAAKGEKRPSGRAKRSKDEVRREFESLLEGASDREPADAKAVASQKAHEEAVRRDVAGVTVEAIVQRLAGVGLDVSRALGEVAEKLTAEVRLLASLQEAVAIEQAELARLHKLDIVATSIDHLLET